jgi:CubicO group peptidase (beta-lactamase class C family)
VKFESRAFDVSAFHPFSEGMPGRMLLAGLLALVLAAGPAEASVTARNFARAAAYSRDHGGLALRVQQGGRVIFEDYYPGWSANTPHRIYSGTKNFVAVGALVAMEEGLLTLDEPASRTLPEWRHDERREITIDQLLSQTSGLDPGSDIIESSRDQLRAALRVPLIATPGEEFHYGPVGYQAFGEILKRKLRPTGQSLESFLRRKVFDRLGIDIAYWKHDDAGNPLMHAGLWLTSAEWGKFGEYVKNAALGRDNSLIDHRLFRELLVGHAANPAYGLSFWLNEPQSEPRRQKMTDLQPAIDGDQIYPGGPPIYAAIGTSKQRLYVIPSLDLVVVRFGYESRFSDGDFLSRLLTGEAQPDEHTH